MTIGIGSGMPPFLHNWSKATSCISMQAVWQRLRGLLQRKNKGKHRQWYNSSVPYRRTQKKNLEIWYIKVTVNFIYSEYTHIEVRIKSVFSRISDCSSTGS